MLTGILIVVALVLLLLEVFTVSTFFIWVSIGVFASAIVSLFTNDSTILVMIGIVVSVISVFLFRGKYLSKISNFEKTKTSYEEMIGKTVLIKEGFKGNTTEKGTVRVNNLDWSVISEEDEEFKVGDKVQILKIDGIKLIIKKEK